MEINPNSLYQELQAMASEAKFPNQSLQQMEINPSKAEFSEMLSQAINNVRELQATSRDMQERYAMGEEGLSLAEVMIAKEKSGVAFEATLQVRNKLLEAYRTIMNMPV